MVSEIRLTHVLSGRRRWLLAATGIVAGMAAIPALGAATGSVTAPIEALVSGLLQVMKAGSGTPFATRFGMLAPVIERTFDLVTVLQESVGSTWGMLPPDQQQMLFEAFQRYTVASYVNSFNEYNGQRFEVKPTLRPVGNGEQVVQTEITATSGESHELDYVMRQGASGWRAVDVLADGAVSRVAVQRSDFRRLLSRGGAQALAKSLRSKSADLSDGSS